LPCKPGRTTGCNYFALLRTHPPELLQKLAMPFPALKATIVLPAFTRSLPADETSFIYHVMGRYEASSSPCIAIMLVEEDPSYQDVSFFNHVMGNLFQHPTRKVGRLLSMWLSE
jgi:hypothetical protein